jgi:DNA-binding response OmpR family regulator
MPHRIPVVDDAPDLALILRMMLERAGHEVISADNGRHGLRRFFETRPDLVILDVRMPELDGWQTLERLRDLSDVPVLMYSGTKPTPEQLERLRPELDAFQPKPARGPEIVSQVGELLDAACAAA